MSTENGNHGPVTGGFVHSTHPFATPRSQRDVTRQVRARLPMPVTVWTAGTGARAAGTGAQTTGPATPAAGTGAQAAGLTVSSMLIARGEPDRALGLLDPDSELVDALLATGRGRINLLGRQHRHVADVFAGLAPSPGGMFTTGDWDAIDGGPALRDARAQLAVEVESTQQVGWGLLVIAGITDAAIPDGGGGSSDGEDSGEQALLYLRGRYRGLAPL